MQRQWSEARSAASFASSSILSRTALRPSLSEARLPLLLDRLALAQSFATCVFDEAEYPDPPDRDQAALRDLMSRRFPNYGYYNLPEFIAEKIGESGCVVGDAIDDLVDITCELLDVEWCWSHTSEADALWRFQYFFKSHWREHLRGLQLYLSALERGQ